MPTYASNTTVNSDKSRAEIEQTLRRYGAESFAYMSSRDRAVIVFEAHNRRIKFELALPDPKDPKFRCTPSRRQVRSPDQAAQAWEQACRQRWRALALVVKAKLEAVEAGITTFEEEFLAHIVLPGGDTVGSRALPAIDSAYTSGHFVPLLEKL
jgi:hypothetical protein